MKLPRLRGKELVKILCNKFGFSFREQHRSHAVLNGVRDGIERTTTVPLHAEVAKGTLLGILKQSGLTREDLEWALK